MEEQRVLPGLRGIEDRFAAREPKHDAAPDQQHGQRRDEGWDLKDRDQDPVGQTDQKAEAEADQDPGNRSHIVEARRKCDREDDRDQPEGRADGKVEILVDDDEGHADRHHRVARRVAQQGVKGLGRAEEIRVDEAAAEVEQRHQDEKAGLPAADELGRRAAAESTGS
jgi:hypothetical protein